MLVNPELRRNIWLDFTRHRMIITPIIISLLCYLSYFVNSTQTAAGVSYALACFFMFIWGPRHAAESVIDEINENTWDQQRQTAISPWAMTLGKLLGSTLFSWYAAIFSLAWYYFFESNTSATGILREITILVLGGLLTQSLALLISLQVVPKIYRMHSNKSFLYFFIAFVTGSVITTRTLTANENLTSHIVYWFSFPIREDYFSLLSLSLFLFWSIIGLYRSFRQLLQYPTLPIVWFVFCLFNIFYFSGIVANRNNLEMILQLAKPGDTSLINDIKLIVIAAPYTVAFFITILLTYIAAFTDYLNIVRYQKLFFRIKDKLWISALEQFPIWGLAFGLMLITAIISILMLWNLSSNTLDNFSPTIVIITGIFFVIRDLLLIHYFNFTPKTNHVFAISLIYLFLLYALIPPLLHAVGLGHWNVLFFPNWGNHLLMSLIGIATQIGLLAYLCLNNWKQYTHKMRIAN